MAITLYSNADDVISVKDLASYLDARYKYLDVDALQEVAPLLQALGNNRRFLSDYFLQGLKDLSASCEVSPHHGQTIILASCVDKFIIRANIWLPEGDLNRKDSLDVRAIPANYFPHDHNFDFMTIGYIGPGYKTEIWEYDHHKTAGVLGEKIEMNFLESTDLPEKKIMIYRASRDLHVQLYPDELSVSLNILAHVKMPYRDQYAFCLRKKTLAAMVRCPADGRKNLIHAASHLCDDNVIDVLGHIAINHKCRHTREAAFVGLERRNASEAHRLASEFRDKQGQRSPIVIY